MKDKVENIHENHRARVRQAYIERGDLNGMHEHEILELLLFYAIKRRDVNPLAHRLIDRFGSLKGVLSAGVADLCDAGLSESTAVLLKLTGDIGKAIDQKDIAARLIKTTDDALSTCHRLLFRESEEVVALICLDAKKRVIKIGTKTDGMVNKVNALPKWIVDVAFSAHASAVVLAHNHPSGSITPSSRDLEVTVMLEKLLEPLGITLYDHVIVTHDSCYSIRRDYEKRFDLEEKSEEETIAETRTDAG